MNGDSASVEGESKNGDTRSKRALVRRRLQRSSHSQSSTESGCASHTGHDLTATDSLGSSRLEMLPSSPEALAAPAALTRKESYKDQRRRYRHEKRRAADELLSTVRDPAVVVRADWLKVRGTLKSWTKLWCVLKPGLLVLYKSEKAKNSHWVGTVLLASCRLIERPSKKDGFCFKLYHPLEQSIWSTKGPDGESSVVGAVVLPLPNAHLICRAPTQSSGKCWMDALELSMTCSSLLRRSMNDSETRPWSAESEEGGDHEADSRAATPVFDNTDDGGRGGAAEDSTDDGDGSSVREEEELCDPPPALETTYCENTETLDPELLGGGGQTEELADENKNLLWYLLKQLRPGMDLSKVVLPTFILEPRSFLDKLSDYYYHADYLSRAISRDDPYLRMREIAAWYLSGFYKKPKGLKKPYNPILGETFRCYWQHPNGSRTFYIAEQVSHHPPISAFYVSNRRDGFCISSTILAKSKFYGNSTSAILDGTATLTLLPRGEVYRITMPYAHCKGILVGTLSMELGGKVSIECEKTGYSTELEFKLKPLWSGADDCNRVSGKLRLGRETLATIDGKWDGQIFVTDKRSQERTSLWNPNPEVVRQRLRRFTVPVEEQDQWESERLWSKVSREIIREDQLTNLCGVWQEAATHEKFVLEEAQRNGAKERKATGSDWTTKYFVQEAAAVRKELSTRVSRLSESSSPEGCAVDGGRRRDQVSPLRLQRCLQPLEQLQRETAAELAALRRQLQLIQSQLPANSSWPAASWLLLAVAVLVQLVGSWWLRR